MVGEGGRDTEHPPLGAYPSSDKATACTYGVVFRECRRRRSGRELGGKRVSHLYAFVGLHSRVACSHVAAATTNPPSVRLEGTYAGTPVDIPLPKSHVLVAGREVKLRARSCDTRDPARWDLPRRGSRGIRGASFFFRVEYN